MNENIKRFGKLANIGGYDTVQKGLHIKSTTVPYDVAIRVDYDDVNHKETKAFAKALIKLWNEQA